MFRLLEAGVAPQLVLLTRCTTLRLQNRPREGEAPGRSKSFLLPSAREYVRFLTGFEGCGL